MTDFVLRFVIALAAMLGGFATSFLWPNAGTLWRWAADGAAVIFAAVILTGKMLMPVVVAWLPRLYTGGASVFIAVLSLWPNGFGLPFDGWVARCKLDFVAHLFGLIFTTAAMAITTLVFLTPPTGLT